MTNLLLLCAIVIFACVFLNKISARIGIPMLLAFILLGMLFGSDGLFKIPFENYSFAEDICTGALIFIMFYGGFGTNWEQARSTAGKAVLLSSAGVVITAVLTGVFIHFALGLTWEAGMLMGSIIGSTDAASVFSVLRSRKLNLKDNTASLLELESGSNDPFAYLLTMICIQAMQGETGASRVLQMLVLQIGLGLAFGALISLVAVWVLQHVRFETAGFDTVFVMGVALLAYAAPTALGGNGYLSTYLAGLFLGNHRIPDKKNQVHFFDGLTGLMQMLIFFLLGLLSTPSRLPAAAGDAILIALFLTFVARPAAVAAILGPAGDSLPKILLVSFSGLRGAASIVFAILAVEQTSLGDFVFHTTFVIVLLSILFQGTLLPAVAKRLHMTDDESDVMKTFNDYSEETPVQFIRFRIPVSHPWVGKALKEITFPPQTLVVLREHGGTREVPNGESILCAGDVLILSALEPGEIRGVHLFEIPVKKGDHYAGKTLSQIPREDLSLIILIQRGSEVIIPNGGVLLQAGDILVLNQLESTTHD